MENRQEDTTIVQQMPSCCSASITSSTPVPAPTPVQNTSHRKTGRRKRQLYYCQISYYRNFLRKPSPDKPMFVKWGNKLTGDVLCVIEAMKLFNEIESEVSGKIIEVLVDDSSPVEFEQPLFLIDPS